MKALLLALVLFLPAAHADDWQSELTSPEPGSFPMLRPLRAKYTFGWSGIKAAEAEFDFSRTRSGQLRLAVTAKSTGVARALWRMDAQNVSLADPQTLQPISVRQSETYSDETLTTRLDFGPAGVTRLRTSNKKQLTPAKTKTFELPGVLDLHTALLFVRSQALSTGENYRFVVYSSTNGFLAEVSVAGNKKLKISGKERDTIQLDLKLRRINEQMQLEPHRKFKRASAWLSDDRDRLILKVQADVAVGSVWTELQKVEFSSAPGKKFLQAGTTAKQSTSQSRLPGSFVDPRAAP